MGNDFRLTGILAATVTPFTLDQSDVDTAAIKRLADHIIGGGVHGLVPGGSTGEFTTLSSDERKRTNELWIEAAAGRVPVVAGTAALTTPATVELSKHASDAGASAVMVVPPFYDGLSFDEVLAHYSAVSDAIDVPIMYYNIPSASGVSLSPEQLAELARKTRVTCFKDTSGDAVFFASVLQNHADDIAALNGWDTLTFASLTAGTEAGVWGLATVLPQQSADLYDALSVRVDLAAGRDLWATLYPICEFLEARDYVSGIKEGLELIGQSAGPVRRPRLQLAQQDRAELADLLTAAGATVVDR